MPLLASLLSILANTLGILGTLMLLVLLLAGSPNSSPEQWRLIKWMLLGTLVFGSAAAIAGIWWLAAGRPWLGLIIGGSPMALVFGVIVWVTISTGR